MSKRIYKNIDDYINQNEPDIEDMLEFLNDLLMNDKNETPKPKTTMTRYSLVKKYIRENYGSMFSEKELKNIKPPQEIIDFVVQKDISLKENKKDIVFNKKLVDKIFELRFSKNIFDLFIFVQFILGRRMSEIKSFDYSIKSNSKNTQRLKMKLAKKNVQNKDTYYEIGITPGTQITNKQLKSMITKIRDALVDVTINDTNKRLNRHIKNNLRKDLTSHSLRGISATYNYHINNTDGQNIIGFIQKYLQQDCLDSACSYGNYKYVID